ncbi:hypothetical protein CCR75_002895 [Bremia lactucae]|uniref:Uncharacterized protein n=1 Tax=Bremia lactucae TaxID=4779 RepID=A0A976FNW2_BRELC|nr:hypothetical protein CCR75_002895 [Bremia lactucae]
MQVNRTAAACTWREAFGELLVLDQDFDTAMQIMISQDDKVAQLSLEESQQTRSKHTKQTKGESRSPNRKRRCIDLKDTSRPKSPPYPSPCIHLAAPTRVGIRLNDTLAADRLIGVYDSRVDIAANRTSTQCSKNVASNHLPTIAESDKKVSISETKLDEMLMQQDSFRDSFQASVSANTMLNSTFKQHDASFKIGYRGEGKTGSNADIHGADSRDGTVTKSVTSLFCTGSGKPVPISKTTLNAYEKQMQFDDSNQFVFFNAALAATSKQLEAGLQSTCGGNGQTGVNADVDVSGHDKSAEKKSVTSLFSTGSGKQISISKSKLDTYNRQLFHEDNETVSAGKIHDFNQIGFRMINDCSTYSNLCNKLSSAIEIVGNPDVDQAVNRAVDDTTNDRTTLTVGSNLKENFLSHRLPTSKDKFHVITKLSGSSTKKVQLKFEKSAGHADDALLSGRQRDTRRRALRDYNTSERSMDRRADFNKFTALGLKAESSHYLPDAVSGDKENISPEDMLARKVTKVQTPITLRSSMRPKQLSSRPVFHQATRQQKKVKSQSRPKLASSRQFHPPLASKSLSTSDPKCSTEERGPLTAQRSKKQKITAIQPFIYKEAMKISLAALNELYGDRRFVTEDHELARMQVLDSITAENALMVCFGQDSTTLCLLNGTHDTSLFIAPHELYRQLIAENLLLKEKGATMVWFLNHFRWIVWKLASIERAYPRLLLTQYLTKGQLLKQMTYRYRRDLNNAECSILKKVLQRDASSLSCMVLCIAGVLPFPACSQKGVDQELPPFWNLAVVLTDGWYSLYAVPDAPLAAVLWKLHTKSILVGTKIVTWNATLRNSTEGIDPLECAIVRESKWKNPLLATEEMTLWPYLQLRYNSTRRVRFNTRLGVEKLHCVTPINLRHRNQESQVSFSLLKSVPLKSLEIGGGMIRSVRIRVIRVSPILHLQSKEWTLGPRILSEEQLSLYFQLRSEYARAARQKNCRQADNDSLMDNRLDDNQIDMPLPIPFIKIDVECAHNTLQADQGIGCGILTIWRPSEDLLAGELREGAEYFASSLTISWKIDNGRGQDASLRLSSTKHSNFEKIRDDEMLANSEAPSLSKRQQVCVSIQRATKDYRANYEEGRNERRPTIDVCVCVVLVAAREIQNIPLSVVAQQTENTLLDPDIRPHETRYVEHIFVTDQSCHLMSIRLSSTEVHLPKNSSFVFRRGGKNLWKEGAVLCLRGLEVSHYDEQLRVLDCVMVESTQIVSFPSKKSPFWDPFQLLQQEASMCSTRGMTAQASSLSSKFLEELLHLKKYVERDILQINCISSQKSQEYEEVEQERLTQDLQAHEGIQDIVLDQNCTDEVARSQLWWDAKVVKMMPLLDSGSFMSVDNVEVLASVNIGTNESSFRTVYLSRRIMLAMHTLLQEADDFNSMNQLDAITANSSIFLLQSITQRLKSFKDRNAEFIFRFQVRQATNERLISSWRPWQHSHASYWKAETVVASQTPR